MVDDHPLYRHGLALTLQFEPDLEILGAVGSASEARDLVSRVTFDVAVVDVLMPTTSGFTLCSELHELQPDCKLLILSAVDDPGVISDLLRNHASGFASKMQPTYEIVDAIRQTLAGHRYIAPHLAIAVAATGPSDRPLLQLTPREREVFECVIRGWSNDEIAARMFISRRTVETHRQRVTNKLSAHTVAQLQRIAARNGGLEAPMI